MAAPTTAPAPILRVRRVEKRFGSVQALAAVDLDFRRGEVHGVLGENGAGKSTLMHVLAGLERPDSGSIMLEGAPVRFASPRDARRAGIGMVHQHFTLVGALTVAENLALSLPHRRCGRFDADAAAAQARALAERVGLALAPPETPVTGLPVGARQRLEILKALASAGRVLILDEPTAVLTPQEVRQLFAMLRRLRDEGRLVIFITHKLGEVKEVADRVTIMRRGRIVDTYDAAAIDEAEMAERMVGKLAPVPARTPRAPLSHAATAGVPTLRVAGVSADDARGAVALDGVSFEVHGGEIFGIAGVDGNGQRELFEVLVGLLQPSGGTVSVDGSPITSVTAGAALAAGIGHIPPDRQQEGLILAMSVGENFLLSRSLLGRFSRRGLLRLDAARAFARDLARQYAVQFAHLDAPVRSLSGGNQQRVVVARALAQQPRVLVTVNPTRGLDVAAAAAVAEALLNVARQGCAIVLISTDLDEVLDLSDRVSVLCRGRLSDALTPPVDAEQMGLLMAGAAA